MNILLYTDSDVFAGTERHILDLAGGIHHATQRDGGQANVKIACPAHGALAQRAQAAGFELIAIPKIGQVDRNAVRKLSSLIRQGEANVIHAHNGRTHVAAALAVQNARRAGAGENAVCIATQHFLFPTRTTRTGLKAMVANYLHRRASRFTAHTVAISDAVRVAAIARRDCPASAITTVHNGISPPDLTNAMEPSAVRESLGIAPGCPMVFCAARLQTEKDIPTLLSAMVQVASQFPTARCFIAGDGDLRSSLEDQLRRMGLASCTTLLGFRHDIPALLRACDLFVLPSLAEPFGLALVEAMALSKPVIATNTGGPPEIVDHERTGLLVPASSPSSMAAAIVRLLANPAERAAFGAAGYARYQGQFTSVRMAEQMLALYRRCLAKASEVAVPAH